MVDYFEVVKDMIERQFGISQDDILEESLLDEDLSITDLDLEDLISQLETKYDVEIPPEKMHSFKKVSDIVSFLYESTQEAI